jgi:CheY-like chemotaxis protein
MILVVDDNSLNRLVIQEQLAPAGYSVALAESVREALELLERTEDVELVLTDLRMPQADGWQLIAQLRQKPSWSHIAILVMSGFADRAAVQRAKEFAVDGFLVKPVSGVALRKAVGDALRKRTQYLEPAARTIERLGINEAQYRRLVAEFADEVRRLVERIRSTGEQGPDDAGGDAELKAELLNLGESCRMLGAERLLASIGTDADGPSGGVGSVLDELVALGEALAGYLAEPGGDAAAAKTEPAAPTTPDAEPPSGGGGPAEEDASR